MDYIKLYYDEAGVASGVGIMKVSRPEPSRRQRELRESKLQHVRLTIFDVLLYVLFENFNETRCGIIFGFYLQ